MKIAVLIAVLACVVSSLNQVKADVIVNYSIFNDSSGTQVSTDSSAQTNWVTSVLTDLAIGTGALGASNQSLSNRIASNSLPGNPLVRTNPGSILWTSNNREDTSLGGGNPLGTIGESTWFSFSTNCHANFQFDFTGQNATVDTYAFRSLAGTASGANWSLYYSTDGGATYSLVDSTKIGQASTTQNLVNGPAAITFDLSAIGIQTGALKFLLDPVSSGPNNGAVTQRSIGFSRVILNATVSSIPEPSVLAFCGLVGMTGISTRRRRI